MKNELDEHREQVRRQSAIIDQQRQENAVVNTGGSVDSNPNSNNNIHSSSRESFSTSAYPENVVNNKEIDLKMNNVDSIQHSTTTSKGTVVPNGYDSKANTSNNKHTSNDKDQEQNNDELKTLIGDEVMEAFNQVEIATRNAKLQLINQLKKKEKKDFKKMLSKMLQSLDSNGADSD